jgi:Flp pilus assembly protein TadD
VSRAPDFQPGHVLLAMAYARMGRTEDAERQRTIAQKLAAADAQKQAPPASAPPKPEKR